MPNLIYILGDQLSKNISSLENISKKDDIILMCEVSDEARYVPHHKKKLVYIFSVMRHFAKELKGQGYNVEYYDFSHGFKSFTTVLKKAIDEHKPEKVIITESGEYRTEEIIDSWADEFNIAVEKKKDTRFISDRAKFAEFAKGKKELRMEYFYRQLRKETNILIDKNNKPEGGKWNYDASNRKALPKNIKIPEVPKIAPDEITQEVIDLIERNFPDNFGITDNFIFAVTAKDAEKCFDDFIKNRLGNFGDYQDAMNLDEPFAFHSLISMYINSGLLDPLECCKKVEKVYKENNAPLNAVEGFIRQILGWREFMRGIYWHFMPEYKSKNELGADRKIPEYFWDETKTEMKCISEVVKQTKENAYSHHIQRLMVTGNFAMLYGIKPEDINEWYLAVYADAYEWVELPNTHGMATYADGGIVGSKPYAASGKYINRMGDFCKSCKYNVNENTGENACPFNYLYWNFIIKHEDKFANNPRMKFPYMNLKNKSQQEIEDIVEAANSFIK